MNPTKLEQIAEFAGATPVSGDADISVQKVSTDSRTTKRGDLFVALRGEKFDGHKFVEAAAETGAAGAIVDLNWKGTVPKNFAILQVDDTLRAYQNLAANYRKSLPIKVLASTGSNLHISVRELLDERRAMMVLIEESFTVLSVQTKRRT
jgi:UDP-N-acetylmuramoyl-tripeptide--D-alanyl-D-alanine ligase